MCKQNIIRIGWLILRFWESEIKKDRNSVIEKILKAIDRFDR
ncbi:DUF559 domain-containing protein [Treponema pedis]